MMRDVRKPKYIWLSWKKIKVESLNPDNVIFLCSYVFTREDPQSEWLKQGKAASIRYLFEQSWTSF